MVCLYGYNDTVDNSITATKGFIWFQLQVQPLGPSWLACCPEDGIRWTTSSGPRRQRRRTCRLTPCEEIGNGQMMIWVPATHSSVSTRPCAFTKPCGAVGAGVLTPTDAPSLRARSWRRAAGKGKATAGRHPRSLVSTLYAAEQRLPCAAFTSNKRK
jgi:hypothetical protein